MKDVFTNTNYALSAFSQVGQPIQLRKTLTKLGLAVQLSHTMNYAHSKRPPCQSITLHLFINLYIHVQPDTPC